jgi:VanZ family protein
MGVEMHLPQGAKTQEYKYISSFRNTARDNRPASPKYTDPHIFSMNNLMYSIYYHSDKLALLLVSIIGWLSLTPNTSLLEVPISDKLEHFLAYALLGLLASLRRDGIRLLAITLLTIIAYGGLIELIQPYVNRYREPADFLANSLGALGGLLVALPLQRRFNRRHTPPVRNRS